MHSDEARQRMVTIAKDILAEQRNPIEAVREICSLLFDLPEYEDDMFATLIGFESETEDIIVGDARAAWAEDYIRKTDAKFARWWPEIKPHVFEACRAIVHRYASAC